MPMDSLRLVKLRELAANSLSDQVENDVRIEISEADVELLEPSAGGEYEISGNQLLFADKGARDQLAAEHHFYSDPEGDEAERIAVALKIRDREGWKERGVAGRYLALAHTQRDVFLLAANSIRVKSFRAFDVLDVIQSALPHILNPSVDGLVSLCDAQYEHTKHDLMQGRFFDVFGDCYKENLDLFRSIIEAVREEPKDSVTSLYTTALLRISETEPSEAISHIFRDVNGNNSVLIASATWALGRLFLFHRVPGAQLSASVEYLADAATNSSEAIRRAAYVAIAEGALVHPPLASRANDILSNEDQDFLRALAFVMFQRTDEAKSNPNFDRWISALSALRPQEESALENMDFVLAGLLKNDRQEFVLSVLEAWILRNLDDMPKTKELTKLFDSTFRDLLNDPAIRSRLITSWLVRDEHQMRKAVEAILSVLHLQEVHQIEFAPEVVREFGKDDLILLIRRMLGMVIYEEHLVSLSFSLLSIDGAHESLRRFVEEALTNDIGFDFPALTCDRLRKLKSDSESEDIKAICDRVIASIDSYFDDLKALPQIKEVRPSQDLRAKILKQQSKTMAVHQKAAEESSIVRLISTVVPLKAGRASFSFRDGGVGEPSHLHSFEHSITLPRRHVLDTVGYELSRLGYRTAEKGK